MKPRPQAIDENGHPLASDALIAFVKEQQGHDRLLMSFSMGKDSVAMWLYLRDHFEIIPYFLYWLPGLSFVDQALDYFEEVMGQHITRLPHPLFYKLLGTLAYQEPHVAPVVASMDLPLFDYADVDEILALENDLGDAWYCAIGMRAKDNIDRRNLIHQKGALGVGRRRYYYGIWDWDINQTADIIIKHDIKLPSDYRYWGRTLAAFDYQFLAPLKKYFPKDWARMLEWFPLLEAEIFRYEVVGHAPS